MGAVKETSRIKKHVSSVVDRITKGGERIRSARVRTARSARSRPVSASSSLAGEMGDVPPDGPVDIDALEDDLPPLPPPPTRAPKLGDIKSEKGIESPLEIFPTNGPANDQDEDIW